MPKLALLVSLFTFRPLSFQLNGPYLEAVKAIELSGRRHSSLIFAECLWVIRKPETRELLAFSFFNPNFGAISPSLFSNQKCCCLCSALLCKTCWMQQIKTDTHVHRGGLSSRFPYNFQAQVGIWTRLCWLWKDTNRDAFLFLGSVWVKLNLSMKWWIFSHKAIWLGFFVERFLTVDSVW